MPGVVFPAGRRRVTSLRVASTPGSSALHQGGPSAPRRSARDDGGAGELLRLPDPPVELLRRHSDRRVSGPERRNLRGPGRGGSVRAPLPFFRATPGGTVLAPEGGEARGRRTCRVNRGPTSASVGRNAACESAGASGSVPTGAAAFPGDNPTGRLETSTAASGRWTDRPAGASHSGTSGEAADAPRVRDRRAHHANTRGRPRLRPRYISLARNEWARKPQSATATRNDPQGPL